MLEERVREWTKPWVEEGRQAGMREGNILLLTGVLEEKFGSVPEAVAERISAASQEEMLRWAKRALSAATLDQVFQSD